MAILLALWGLYGNGSVRAGVAGCFAGPVWWHPVVGRRDGVERDLTQIGRNLAHEFLSNGSLVTTVSLFDPMESEVTTRR